MYTRTTMTCGLAVALLAAAPCMAEEPAVAGEPSAGAWQQHEYTFTYAGFQSAYSCDWLEEKLRLLLKKAGARADMHISTHCMEPSGPSPGAEAHVVFHTLAPAAAGDVPAVWRAVKLREHVPLALEASDCELVDQFRAELLPFFTTRALQNHMQCRPGENASRGIDLQFEVLAPPQKGGR